MESNIPQHFHWKKLNLNQTKQQFTFITINIFTGKAVQY